MGFKMRRNFALCVVLIILLAPIAAYAYGGMTGYSHIVRVGLTRSFTNQNSITVSNTNIAVVFLVDEGFMPLFELTSSGGFTVRNDGGRVTILSGGSVLHSFLPNENGQIMATDAEFIRMGGYSYRGIMEFVPASGGRVSAINVLSLEEYLLGVLPSEMGPGFHIEALRAQAVASRTFTFHQMRQGRHLAAGFDICDTTCCQVYRGAGTENDISTQAVFSTYGLMLFHNNQPILANYFSSSGGATENSEDVWFEARPYARSVNEIAEHNPMVWERTFTWAQLTQAAAAQNAGIGQVTGVSISQLAPSGRVLNLTFHGTGGEWTALREVTIRNFFAPIGGSLPSRNFQIVGGLHTTPTVYVANSTTSGAQNVSSPLNSMQSVDSRGAISTVHMAYIYDGTAVRRINSTPSIVSGGSGITLRGRGWGHGVGMSQMGAEGMAREGFSFAEILHHYFTGVELRWYE